MTPIDVGNGLRLEVASDARSDRRFEILGVDGNRSSRKLRAFERFVAWEVATHGEDPSYPTEQAAIDAIEAFRELEMRR